MADTFATRDHPRGCGENLSRLYTIHCQSGSPPRMRGKPEACNDLIDWCRITPADAGKTRNATCCTLTTWDHPRGCGKNVFRKRLNPWRKGSPPRMRGKRLKKRGEADERGITPADAGKTLRTGCFCRRLQDHPRGCGENHAGASSREAKTGSPPRMRGKRLYAVPVPLGRGITPADAGKTNRKK